MHPYQEHRQHHKERSRVHHIAGEHEEVRTHHIAHRASGGRIHHEDAAEDAKMVRHMVKSSALKSHKAEGGAVSHRQDKVKRARGGRTKHKGHTNVNVIVAPQGGHPGAAPMPAAGPAMAPPSPGGMPPRPPMAGPPGAPPGMPPGGAPGMMPPPGLGPRATGGRIGYAKGGGIKSGAGWTEGLKNMTPVQHTPNKGDGANIGRGKPMTYRTGGGVHPANASMAPRKTPSGVAGLSGGLKRKTGGPIYAPETGHMGPKLPGGAGGERAREAKIERARKMYAKA